MTATARGGSVAGAVLLLLLLPHPTRAQDPMLQNPTSRIQTLRAESNAALAAGDLRGFMATIDPDYVGTGGDGGHVRSRAALEALIADVFATPDRLYFVRTPDRIDVADDGRRVMENGRWEGRRREASAEIVTGGGRYTAYWRRVDGRWVIHAEVFVTLDGA